MTLLKALIAFALAAAMVAGAAASVMYLRVRAPYRG